VAKRLLHVANHLGACTDREYPSTIPRHRGGELALHVDVDILRDVVDDLDDAAAGEREPPLVLAADGIATVVADAETSPQSA
jgi:hypothetical protein